MIEKVNIIRPSSIMYRIKLPRPTLEVIYLLEHAMWHCSEDGDEEHIATRSCSA
jgi:hypothetical protein